MIFLIEYDRGLGTLVNVTSFESGDAATANAARLSLELERMQSGLVREIVILEATSEAQVRKTHRRYFEGIAALANPDAALKLLKAA